MRFCLETYKNCPRVHHEGVWGRGEIVPLVYISNRFW